MVERVSKTAKTKVYIIFYFRTYQDTVDSITFTSFSLKIILLIAMIILGMGNLVMPRCHLHCVFIEISTLVSWPFAYQEIFLERKDCKS